MQRRTISRLPLIIALSGTALLAGCSGSATHQPDQPLVATALAQAESGGTGDAYTGTVHARTESTLAFRVPGKIVQRLVDAGAHVRAGQPLARLDAQDYGLAASAAADNETTHHARRISA